MSSSARKRKSNPVSDASAAKKHKVDADGLIVKSVNEMKQQMTVVLQMMERQSIKLSSIVPSNNGLSAFRTQDSDGMNIIFPGGIGGDFFGVEELVLQILEDEIDWSDIKKNEHTFAVFKMVLYEKSLQTRDSLLIAPVNEHFELINNIIYEFLKYDCYCSVYVWFCLFVC